MAEAAGASLFAPFGPLAVVGPSSSREERQLVTRQAAELGWLATQRVHARTLQQEREVDASIGLFRDSVAHERAYAMLAGAGDAVVSIGEVEARMGHAWTPRAVDGGPVAVDSFCWKFVQSQICDSVRDHLLELDEAVSSLAGMDRQQDTAQMHNIESQRMNAVLHYLPRMMAESSTTKDQLLFKIRGLAAEYTECAVKASKVRIGHQLQGMMLLSRAVRLDTTELEEMLQTAETVQLLGLVVHYSLVEFRAHLRRGGACLEELEGVFPPLPSSVAPPSGWVRYEVLRRWLTLHETVVAEACVAGIGLARRLQSLPTNAPEWSGLHLVGVDSAASAQREWRDWTPPRHLKGGVAAKRIVLTDHHTLGLGLRACRFFDMLETQVLLSLMPLMRIRADLLLPVMARLSASTLVEWSCHERRPVLYDVSAKTRAPSLPVRERRSAPALPELPASPPLSPHASVASVPPSEHEPALAQDEEASEHDAAALFVPVKYRRDYTILCGMFHWLSRAADEAPNEAASVRFCVNPDMSAAARAVRGGQNPLQMMGVSKTSLSQACGAVCRQLLLPDKAGQALRNAGVRIEVLTCPKACRILLTDARGARVLRDCIANQLQQMVKGTGSWKVSKSLAASVRAKASGAPPASTSR